MADRDFDELNLHELSHKYNTEDDESRGQFMNAHLIDDLFGTDLSRWPFFRLERNNIRECNEFYEFYRIRP